VVEFSILFVDISKMSQNGKNQERVIRTETKMVDGKIETRSVIRTCEYTVDPWTGIVRENITEQDLPIKARFVTSPREVVREHKLFAPPEYWGTNTDSKMNSISSQTQAPGRNEPLQSPDCLSNTTRVLYMSAQDMRIEAERAFSAAQRQMALARISVDRAFEEERLARSRLMESWRIP
jgi:hypothetical protein